MGRAAIFPILIAAIAALLVAVLGATITDLGPWYRSLVQPRWAPPDVAYGIGWTTIFTLTAVSGVLAWEATDRPRDRDTLIGLFALNGFLNILWSLLFFRLQRPDFALTEVVFLWVSVLVLIVVIWPRSMLASLLLVPYLGWVTFAGWLNMAIVKLNGPFS